MKTFFLTALVGCAVIFGGFSGQAAAGGDAKTDLQQLVTRVQAKMKEGKTTEKDLQSELKEFDALLVKHQKQKTDDVAQILMMKAMLYIQVFDNSAKGVELVKKVKSDFPATALAKQADEILANLEKGEASKAIQRGLVVGAKFPDFNAKDLKGQPLSIAKFKGKVVLVDFWATWCGPCVQELPSVLSAYKKHHAKGFEIVGISLDDDLKKLNSFIAAQKMTWPQHFDGKGWENKVAQQYGVNSIPATYLLDGEGKIIAKDLRGDALEAAVAKALAKK